MSNKISKIFITTAIISIFISIILLCNLIFKPIEKDRPLSITIYYEEGKDPPPYNRRGAYEEMKEAYESKLISSIGTNREIETIGYNMTYVMKVITAEGGTDQEVCLGCAQSLYNTYIKLNSYYTPEKILEEYQYTQPEDWISDEARYACEQIFIYGNMYDKVEDATVFYNPSYGWSSYHESQEFVCEINGVNFYREIN